MKTLQDAWDWYESTIKNLQRMKRLSIRHWNDESMQKASIWKDENFKQLEASVIEQETIQAIEPLNDLGVLVLFSVFEAAVRDHLEDVIKPLVNSLDHPILRAAAEDALEGIRQGSFSNKVLTPLQEQGRITSEMSDKVRQVRDYRNWIAHGKRQPRPLQIVSLTAEVAFGRLKDFLDALGIVVEAELVERTGSGDLIDKQENEAPQ